MDGPAPWALGAQLMVGAELIVDIPDDVQGSFSSTSAAHVPRPPCTTVVTLNEQPCSRNFWVTRAAARVLARAWVVPALVVAGVVELVGEAGCPQFWDFRIDGAADVCSLMKAPPLLTVENGAAGLNKLAFVGVAAALRELLRDGGALEQLGEQAEWMVLAPPRGQALLVSVAQGYELRRWAQLLGLIAAGLAGAYLPISAFQTIDHIFGDGNWVVAALYAAEVLLHGVAMPLVLAAWLTMKQGAALATREVRVVRCAIHRCDPGSTEWEQHVAQGAKALAQRTLPTLSGGLSGGAAMACAGCWLGSLQIVGAALQRTNIAGLAGGLLVAALVACLPAIILWDLADTSSECDLLVKDLNDKRLADFSDSAHVTIFKLETMLNQLNKNQGLGFVLGGTVLDKRFFFNLLAKLGALAATVLTTLLAFRHDANSEDGGGCGLSEQQQTTAHDVFTSFNATRRTAVRT